MYRIVTTLKPSCSAPVQERPQLLICKNIRVSKVIGALGDNSLGAHLITTALSSAFIRCFYHPEKPSLKTLLLEILLY
jgi:hypothetical protein